ncbi:hypothetical protein MMC13_006250 [Lambiella insularis]|nr:hypothetical protein [Lambiella insularis]
MSWNDTGSRPTKHSAVPPPLYLTSKEAVPYCYTCGRVISTRKVQSKASSNVPVKYCSDRCRHHKPGHIDRKIEDVFAKLLNGSTVSPIHNESDPLTAPESSNISYQAKNAKTKKKKGDPRILVLCSEVETIVFGSRHDPEKVFGRKKNRAARGAASNDDWKSVDMEDSADVEGESHGSADESDEVQNKTDDVHDVKSDYSNFGAGKVRPSQSQAEVNGSLGGEKGWAERNQETAEALEKRKAGERKAIQKELVKSAARRGCAFGFLVHDIDPAATPGKKKKGLVDVASSTDAQGQERRKKCEVVMNGMAVEPSFAKGDWEIRWREEEVSFDSEIN